MINKKEYYCFFLTFFFFSKRLFIKQHQHEKLIAFNINSVYKNTQLMALTKKFLIKTTLFCINKIRWLPSNAMIKDI